MNHREIAGGDRDTADKVADGTSVVGKDLATLATVAYPDRPRIKGDSRLVTTLPRRRASRGKVERQECALDRWYILRILEINEPSWPQAEARS